MTLFDAYVAERKLQRATVRAWKRAVGERWLQNTAYSEVVQAHTVASHPVMH